MASSDPPLYQTSIPGASHSGANISDDNDDFPLLHIQVVNKADQLPSEFLHPSAESQLVIGFDCEGVNICRNGILCIMQIAFPDAVYLVDVIEGGDALMQACKPALESNFIKKVIHDCRRDSEALYFQFGIKLHNVIDTQIAYAMIEEQEGRERLLDDISFVRLLADPRYCGISYAHKEDVRVLLRQDPKFWSHRPMSEMMIHAAADDVRCLLYVYHKMMKKLSEKALWHLAVRGSLYCRCFCINDNEYADWPPLPNLPDTLVAEGYVPEQEILSVVDVPPGKMGLVIGKKGAHIRSASQSCKAKIITGGEKGPRDKVFVIGAVRDVRLAEAVIKGYYMD